MDRGLRISAPMTRLPPSSVYQWANDLTSADPLCCSQPRISGAKPCIQLEVCRCQITHQAKHAEAAAQIDAIDSVTSGGVDGRGVNGRNVNTPPTGEEFTNEGPIGCRGGATPLMATGIAIDLELDSSVITEGLGALEERLACLDGIGVGLEDDFVENVNLFGMALHEERTHGIDVEIDGPDERKKLGVVYLPNVDSAVECIIDTVQASAFEGGFKLLAEGLPVEIAGGGTELDCGDVSSLLGGELPDGPIGLGFGLLEAIEKVIAALRRTNEQSTAVAIGKGGTEDLGPALRANGSEFVENDKIEAATAEGIGPVGTLEAQDGARGESDGELGFRRLFLPKRTRHAFEALPCD